MQTNPNDYSVSCHSLPNTNSCVYCYKHALRIMVTDEAPRSSRELFASNIIQYLLLGPCYTELHNATRECYACYACIRKTVKKLSFFCVLTSTHRTLREGPRAHRTCGPLLCELRSHFLLCIFRNSVFPYSPLILPLLFLYLYFPSFSHWRSLHFSPLVVSNISPLLLFNLFSTCMVMTL